MFVHAVIAAGDMVHAFELVHVRAAVAEEVVQASVHIQAAVAAAAAGVVQASVQEMV